MRLTPKVKAVQCYLSLLIWLVLVSIGLYWYLTKTGSNGLSTVITQSGFGYQDGFSYQDSSETVSGTVNDKLRDRKNKNLQGTDEEKMRDAPSPNDIEVQKSPNKDRRKKGKVRKLKNDPKSIVNRLCNPVQSIKAEDENVQVPEFKLEAIIILFRHGDRGPLTHIGHRNVSHINCASKSADFEQLSKFATDTLMKLPGYSQFIGPFHSFPKVPTSPYCSLGQLSQQGSAQLLALGKMIRSTYKNRLTNFTAFTSYDAHPLKVVAFSTRYRRTFQSLFAFLYGLLGPKQLIQSTTVHESQSITFCFKHCSCKAADRLKKVANAKFQLDPESKEIMSKLVNQFNTVLGTDKSKKTGNSLLDSLLVYPCHKMELPCQQNNQKEEGVHLIFKTLKNFSLYNQQGSSTSSDSAACISPEDLKNLIHLINKENLGVKEVPENRHYHLLSSYGLLKEIVNLALKMTSEPSSSSESSARGKQQQAGQFFAPSSFSSSLNNLGRNLFGGNGNVRPKNSKIVIFSGHDTTIQSITAALGIIKGHPDIHLPPFSSRLIFEFYKRSNVPLNSPRKLYFRVIYNGMAVTHLITFCREAGFTTLNDGDNYKTANKESSSSKNKFHKTLFCPIENLVRFLHDHYFDTFRNVTNFKDACQLNPNF